MYVKYKIHNLIINMFKGSSLLILTGFQSLAILIPTSMITGFCLISLILVGLNDTTYTQHVRLSISLLFTISLGLIGITFNIFGFNQIVSLWIVKTLSSDENTAKSVETTFKDNVEKIFVGYL